MDFLVSKFSLDTSCYEYENITNIGRVNRRDVANKKAVVNLLVLGYLEKYNGCENIDGMSHGTLVRLSLDGDILRKATMLFGVLSLTSL